MTKSKSLIIILSFLLLVKIKQIKTDEDIFKFDFQKFVSFTLLNGNIIIFSNKGFLHLILILIYYIIILFLLN